MTTGWEETGSDSGWKPDSTYVTRQLAQLEFKTRGFKKRIRSIEEVRYLEDVIALGTGESKTGIEVRIGATAEMIETIKASIIANPPMVHVEPQTDLEGSQDNSSKREHFWNRWLERLNKEGPELDRFVDSVVANGLGFLKAYKYDLPAEPRERRADETAAEHVARVKALKRIWGPGLGAISIHPAAMYPRFGRGNKLAEIIEHSYKPRVDMFRNYGIKDKRDFYLKRLGKDILDKEVADLLVSQTGTPTATEKPFPYGYDSSTECLVTEYWSPDWHQVYINRSLIFEEESPRTQYFLALGRTNSSGEMDKLGFGVGELMAANERTVNRGLSRMFEAVELLVHQRTTVQLPEGSTDYLESPLDDLEDANQGESKPREFRFEPGVAKALPPGAKTVNPFEGVQNAFDGMPAIQMVMGIMNTHGANPLFKGVPQAANSSGYNNNSMLNSAKSQYQYIVTGIERAFSDLILWAEKQVESDEDTVYLDELELRPGDVAKWPAKVTVSITPNLPQDMMAKGTFWDRMFASRHVSRRVVREQGLDLEDPEAMEWETMREDLRESLKPQLYLDVIAAVQGPPPTPPETMQPNESETLEPGQMGLRDRGNGAPVRQTQYQQNGAGRSAGRDLAGLASGGQPQAPRILPSDVTQANQGY